MFAIAFDLVVADTDRHHPKSVAQAYNDIGAVLARFGFDRVQGSVYVNRSDDLVAVTNAMNSLRALSWFPESVRDIRAFRVEMWSDFTDFVKS